MIKLGSALFYLGLGVVAAGFLLDKAETLPLALRLVAPSYVRASEGLTALQIKGSLSPGETGFIELESVFRREAEAKGVGEQLSSQPVLKFTRKTVTISFSDARAGEVIPVEIALASNKVDWDLSALRGRAEELKRTTLVRFSTLIFALGIAVTLAGRTLENRGRRRSNASEPAAPPPSD